MEDIQAQMGAILNDPDMMGKIMAMAQSMQTPEPPSKLHESEQQAGGFDLQGIDIGMLQKLSGFAAQSSIDKNQKNLLSALGPYLQQERITKLEKAMRAARLAKLASSVFGQSDFLTGIGR